MAKTKKTSAPKSKSKTPPVTPERITQLGWAFAPPLAMRAAIDNHVFDVLDKGPKTMEQIWAATGASARGIKSLVEALVGLGLLKKKANKFSLAPDTATFLVSTKPGFLGGVLGHLTGDLLQAWIQLSQVVRTGLPAIAVNQQKTGADFFSKLAADLFNLNFAGASALAGHLAGRCKAAGWGGAINVLDVAAGSGVWSIALAKQLPNVQVTAVDWPAVTPVTKRFAKEHGTLDRLRTIDSDFHKANLEKGFHIALLGHILHSEGEVRSKSMLKKIYDALAPGGIIAIAEFTPDDDRSGPVYPLIFSLNMLVNTDEGDTFSFSQISGWLKEIGFSKIIRVPVPAPSPIIVAVKPLSAK